MSPEQTRRLLDHRRARNWEPAPAAQEPGPPVWELWIRIDPDRAEPAGAQPRD